MRSVLIFGASSGVGFELARVLREKNVQVTAMLRSEGGRHALQALGAHVVRGDAFVKDDIRAALASAPPGVREVVSTLGGMAEDGRRADDAGNINVIEVAAEHRAGRFVLVTSIGCGEMAPFMSERARAAFGDAVEAKSRAEERLKASGLSYTIVRPGGLRTQLATGQGILSADPEMHGFIGRADVALLIERVLRDPNTSGRAFAAVEADRARCANPISPFPLVA
ncbi:NAD(P)H-binding protein [Chelativorans sp. AA-79]|uniref:NAD(P)H-binding protein n=1 Tax=Chelativorans sp. AA-79 TaxID=3028735 RepID=UPI0023F9A0A5|nr:NAD(P)H-binding protein [Chelativorans sp. AA-79]WEX08552.1 NAD(P)H-binding protein [Chelativorans sp. AA-79]